MATRDHLRSGFENASGPFGNEDHHARPAHGPFRAHSRHARRGSTAAAGLQQTLQGLLSGNANQDQAVREAYERGYQRGREDEARLRRDRSGTSERSRSYHRAAPRAGAYGGDQDAYPDERQPSGRGR